VLPLRIQVKSVQRNEKGTAAPLDGVYDYTEVHRALEKIVQGEILTHEQLQAYVERRRRELFEARFDQALQQQLQAEREQAAQALEEAHAQDLHSVQEETAQRYEMHIQQLQQQLRDLEARHQDIVKEGARHPELVAKREAELQQKCQEVEEERCKLQQLQSQIQEEQQGLREQLERDLKAQAEETLRAQRAQMDKELKDARAALEDYYSKKDQRRQIRVEKTFRQAIAHGTELLSQSHQWLLLLTTPGMAEGLSWLSEAETVSLLGQIQTVRDTLEKAEEVVLHGRAPDAVSPEEGGEVTNGDDDFKSPKNMGYG
ncbi:MAG TPA: hypothetical protein VFA10_20125, partial [Ktedonobacteraceae bacterium]|nr:hypothetical protein [Ktedonobacteraceae bacterium]